MTFNFSVTAFGEPHHLTPVFGRYHDRSTAIQLYEDEPWRELYGVLTVCVPGTHLNPGEILVKDWSENEEIVASMIDQRLIFPTGRETAAGYAFPKVMTLGVALKTAQIEQEAS